MKRFIQRIESDPNTQYHFHIFMAYFWLATMVAVPFILHPHDTTGWVGLVILEVSLYANFATDYGAASAALAAMNTQPDNREISREIQELSKPSQGPYA